MYIPKGICFRYLYSPPDRWFTTPKRDLKLINVIVFLFHLRPFFYILLGRLIFKYIWFCEGICAVPKCLTLCTHKMLTPGKRKYGRLTEREIKYSVRHKIPAKSTRSITPEIRVPYLHGKASRVVLAQISRAYPYKSAWTAGRIEYERKRDYLTGKRKV